jgi:hypothetical protein
MTEGLLFWGLAPLNLVWLMHVLAALVGIMEERSEYR